MIPEGLSLKGKWAWKTAGAEQRVTAAMTQPAFWRAQFDDLSPDVAVNLADAATRTRMGKAPPTDDEPKKDDDEPVGELGHDGVHDPKAICCACAKCRAARKKADQAKPKATTRPLGPRGNDDDIAKVSGQLAELAANVSEASRR